MLRVAVLKRGATGGEIFRFIRSYNSCGCGRADWLRAFSSRVGILRSMRSGKSIIPRNVGMWETEAPGGVRSY
jgi:hypothetical protein